MSSTSASRPHTPAVTAHSHHPTLSNSRQSACALTTARAVSASATPTANGAASRIASRSASPQRGLAHGYSAGLRARLGATRGASSGIFGYTGGHGASGMPLARSAR